MKHLLILSTLWLAAGCDTPSPGYLNGEKSIVERGDLRFSVYSHEKSAQVVRTGMVSPMELNRIPELMKEAAETATGCRVVSQHRSSDESKATFDLDCSG